MRRLRHRADRDGHRRHHHRDDPGNLQQPLRLRLQRRRHRRDRRCGSYRHRRHHRDDRHHPGRVRDADLRRGAGRRDGPDGLHRRRGAAACCPVWHRRDGVRRDGDRRHRALGVDPADAASDARPAVRWRTGCCRRAADAEGRAWGHRGPDAERRSVHRAARAPEPQGPWPRGLPGRAQRAGVPPEPEPAPVRPAWVRAPGAARLRRSRRRRVPWRVRRCLRP